MKNFTIVIDTREQEPYGFDSKLCSSIRKALPAGDYSVQEYENRVAVERKSMADFVSTVIRCRKRFYNELNKLRNYESACVVVEANYRDIIEGCYKSDAHPNTIIGTIASIIVDFGVPIYFCSDRQAACRFTYEYLIRYYKRIIRCQKEMRVTSRDSGEK